uniref:Uncharacterized protein n=1 Tax=Opuntia streptacantha TaxID=393608 RepID=A0A7C9ETR5_OPUST
MTPRATYSSLSNNSPSIILISSITNALAFIHLFEALLSDKTLVSKVPESASARPTPANEWMVWPLRAQAAMPVDAVTKTPCLPWIFLRTLTISSISLVLPVPADPVMKTDWQLLTASITCNCWSVHLIFIALSKVLGFPPLLITGLVEKLLKDDRRAEKGFIISKQISV